MDIQKIEPLLMDHALGATTADVATLIDALQERDTEVHARLEQWLGIAKLAHRAMEEKTPTALPAFPQQQLQVARRGIQRRRALVWTAGLATCVLIGYLLGSLGHGIPTTPAVVTAVAQPTSTAATDVPVAGVDNFWSISRLRAVAERDASPPVRAPANAAGHRWNSSIQVGG